MKTIIAGSRSITNFDIIELAIKYSEFNITEIICGMANGVDLLGKRYGYLNNIPVIEIPANWRHLGNKAGYIRNREMAEKADALILIWDGVSKGSKHMLDLAIKKKLNIFLVEVGEEDNLRCTRYSK